MTDQQQPSWLWILPVSLLIPLIQLAIFGVRFGVSSVGEMLGESLIFVPAGLIAATALVYLVRRAGGYRRRLFAVLGYLLALPFSLIESLFAPLAFHPLIGTVMGGVPPLVVGALLGYFVASVTKR